MSTGGGGFGSGEYYGSSPEASGGQGGGLGGPGGGMGGLGGGLGALGGLLGAMGGGQGRMSPLGAAGPRGKFGLWPSCGCGSILIILAGILLVCGGCLQMLNQ
jgi:hypothetical protein